MVPQTQASAKTVLGNTFRMTDSGVYANMTAGGAAGAMKVGTANAVLGFDSVSVDPPPDYCEFVRRRLSWCRHVGVLIGASADLPEVHESPAPAACGERCDGWV